MSHYNLPTSPRQSTNLQDHEACQLGSFGTPPARSLRSLADPTAAYDLVQAELDSATWASDLAAGMRARASERVSDGAFLVMGLGMLIVTLSALTAACATLGGVL